MKESRINLRNPHLRIPDVQAIRGREFDHLSSLQVEGTALDLPDPELRALEICEDSDMPREAMADGSDVLIHFCMRLVGPMAEVHPKHIHTSFDQLLQHLRAGAGRTDGRDDLRPTMPERQKRWKYNDMYGQEMISEE